MLRQMPPPVFISYAWKDGAKLADSLRGDLEARGHDVWLDRQRLLGGTSWSKDIEAAIDQAEVVLVLLSAGSFESDVCRGEQLRSLRATKCVIPLLVHVHADRPVYLEARQYLDFSDSGTYPLRFADLERAIKSREGASLAPGFKNDAL